MIFLSANNFLATDTTSSYETSSFIFYWMGFLYFPGYQAGEASIKAILHRQTNGESWEYITGKCMGNFVLTVYDKTAKTYFIATDPSGMFQCYYSPDAFSTHFLELVRYHNLSASDLSVNACIDFLQLGYIYYDQTFFPEINKLPPDTALYWNQSQGLQISGRPIHSLSSSSGIDIQQWQTHLGEALKSSNINMDLTGGTDTRFILAALLHTGTKPDTSTYGHTENRDVLIAKEIVELLNIKHSQQTPHNTEPDPLFYFSLVDGLADISKYIGFYQVTSAKLKAGYNLSINGGGGGICKDFLWQQDIPFYNRTKPNWKRLFKYRISQKQVPDNLLGDRLKPHIGHWQSYWLDNLSRFNDTTNSASYDKLFFETLMRERVGHSNAMESRLIPSYSPILERTFASWCYNQSRFARWLNLIQRNVVTDLDPELAKLTTNHGKLNLSSRKQHIPLQIYNKTNAYFRKGIGFNRRNKSSSTPHNYPVGNHWLAYMQQNEFGRDAIAKLQNEDLLSHAVQINDIPPYCAGRVLTLGLLLRFLEKPFTIEPQNQKTYQG